jgi:predicted Zn finger-like uncharacterized protein
MLIDCPGCAKSYHIIKAALGPNGRRVACPRCDTIWFVRAEASANGMEPNIPATIEISAEDIVLRSPLKKRNIAANARPVQPTPAPRVRSSFLKDICSGVALLAFGMAIIGFRAEIVRLWAPSGTAYAALGLPVNLLGLELRNLRTVSTHEGNEAVLGIEGEIANVGGTRTEVPPIELAIRDREGHELYSWTAKSQKRLLAVGEIILFRARLAAPPTGGHEVVARFATAEPETLAWR